MKNEHLILTSEKNISDLDKELCQKYWQVDNGVYIINTTDLIQEYSITSVHQLLKRINAKSKLVHKRECSHEGCQRKLIFNSRSSLETSLSFNKFGIYFPYCDQNTYNDNLRKYENVFTFIAHQEGFYCKYHSDKIFEARKKQRTSEFETNWQLLRPTIEPLLLALREEDFYIFNYYYDDVIENMSHYFKSTNGDAALLEESNYYKAFNGYKIVPDRFTGWSIFVTYWQRENNDWKFSIPIVAATHNISVKKLNKIISCPGVETPSLCDTNELKQITNRQDFEQSIKGFDEISSQTISRKEQEKVQNDCSIKSMSLRHISKNLLPYEASVLNEAADLIDNLIDDNSTLVLQIQNS